MKSKSIFLLILIILSGFIISCNVNPISLKENNPIIVYIKNDGLYLSYLNKAVEIKIHEGTDFIYPKISNDGSYIAYTYEGNLYIFDIENNKYKEIDKEIVSYTWIDNESLVYSTKDGGFTKLDYKNQVATALRDDYYYDNFKSSKDKLYGKRIVKWSNSEGDFQYTEGIVEIDLKTDATSIIIEGKKSTDEIIGYDPTIYDISHDGRYIYIMEKFASGSLSADIGGIGVYDVVERTHTDFSDIYGNNDELTVIPRENNMNINPKDSSMISIIKGSGREMISNKEVVLLDINKDKTYKIINFMDENLVAMTPHFTTDGGKLLYSATTGANLSNTNDYNEAFENWYNEPHNIYEYDLKTSKVEKLTDGDGFDFMPIDISKDTILFIRYKDGEYSLIKLNNGNEELVADNIIFNNQYYGYIDTKTSMDILKYISFNLESS